MKSLLENDLPAHYGVGRRRSCAEIRTTFPEFDLTEDDACFVVDYKTGFASFCDNPYLLSVINYDTYIGKFTGTEIAEGRRRCDFVITDVESDEIVILCELTSSIGGTDNLLSPIKKKKKDGGVTVVFPGGKYQKAEFQLSQSLETMTEVPSIAAYFDGKRRKVCLMSYLIKPANDNAVNAFNRNRLTEAEEAGENGAQVSCPQIERYGFDYFRISHAYSFRVGTVTRRDT